MAWADMTFDWNQLRAVLATIEEGSLSAAARALGLAQPTVGRQVAALEEALNLALFERAGRELVPTPAGLAVAEHARAMRDAAARVALVAAGQAGEVAGTVSLSASDAIAAYVLPELLEGLRARAPEVHVRVVVTNAQSDLLRREAEIALRHVRPAEPELIARRVHTGAAYLYAAPAFLERHGRPGTLEDLRGLPFVGLTEPRRMAALLRGHGIAVRDADIPVHSESSVTGWELVRRGMGIGLMFERVARETPDVERIVPGFAGVPVEIWLTTHRDLHGSRRIRLVFDALADALQGQG